MMITCEQISGEMVDREAIRDCLYRYARGVDRCDEELVRSAYWEDAYDYHGLYDGTREPLIAWMMPLLRGMESCQHSISNVLIRLHGDAADVESYWYGNHRVSDGTTVRQSVQSGRYLDRMEKRDDEWRIAWRKVEVDWFRDFADAGDWTIGPMGQSQIKPGLRYPEDDSYTKLDLARSASSPRTRGR